MSFLLVATFFLFLGLSGAVSADAQEQPAWEACRLTDLIELREASGRSYLSFIDRPSMSVGLYELPAGTVDRQSPHQRDEIYYVVSGKGMIQVDDDAMDIAPGSIVFVRAGSGHSFHSLEGDLDVLILWEAKEAR